MKSDEELTILAEELNARGTLSVDRLTDAAGGGQRERLMAIVKQVRTAAAARPAPQAEAAVSAGQVELPAGIRDGLARVAADVVRELAAVRTSELNRARAAEAAAAARYDAAIRAAETQIMLVNEDLAACENEVQELRSDLERLTVELSRANGAIAEAGELRQADSERHSQERLALAQALSRAQEEAARFQAEAVLQADARSQAQADAAASSATASAAAAELDRVRQDNASLRAQCDALLRQLSSAETERDRALQDLQAAGKVTVPQGAAPVPEPPSARRRSRRKVVPS